MNDDILQHHFDEVFNALQDRENFEIFTKIKPTRTPRVKRTFFKIISPSEIDSAASFDEVGISGKSPRRLQSQRTFKLTPYNSRPSSASATTVKAKATFKPPFQRPTSPRPKSPRPRAPTSFAERFQAKLDSSKLCHSGPVNTLHSSRPTSCGPRPIRSLTRPQSVGPVVSRGQTPRPFSSRPQTPNVLSFRPDSPKPVSSRAMSERSTVSSMAYYSLKSSTNDILGECKYCGRYILGDFLQIHEDNCERENFCD